MPRYNQYFQADLTETAGISLSQDFMLIGSLRLAGAGSAGEPHDNCILAPGD